MSDFIHFYIDTWYQKPVLDIILKASKVSDKNLIFVNGLLDTFGNPKWVENNKIFVCQEWVDQAIFLYVSCPVEWAKENCPEIFNEENKERIVSENEILSTQPSVFFTTENIEFGYYLYDDEENSIKRFKKEDFE